MLIVTEELVVDTIQYATIKHMILSQITDKKKPTDKRLDFYKTKLNMLESKK
jgi:hypothetical protein